MVLKTLSAINEAFPFSRFSSLSRSISIRHKSKLSSSRPLLIMEGSTPIIYHSLNSIKEFINKEEFNNITPVAPVKKLLSIYDDLYGKYGHLLNKKSEKKHPLIVFEGLDGSGKTTISRRVSNKFHASLLITPPDCTRELRSSFDDHILRTAYYCLGNYIAELEIVNALEKGPVVLDRFWHSTAAFAIAQCVQNGQIHNLPARTDSIYIWPSDLLKPDLVVLLSVSEHIRQSRHSRRNTTNTEQEQLLKENENFRANVIQAYGNMDDPKVAVINGDGSINQTVGLVSEEINKIIKE